MLSEPTTCWSAAASSRTPILVGDLGKRPDEMMLMAWASKAGAQIYPAAILDHSFADCPQRAGKVLGACRILAGLASSKRLRRNGQDRRRGRRRDRSPRKELLVLAKKLLPRLPFERLDLLLIDEIGKKIAARHGHHIVGRKFNDHEAVGGSYPRSGGSRSRGLSQATHGNAIGIGIAEFCTTKCIRQIDLPSTRVNTLTAAMYRPACFRSTLPPTAR